LNSLKVAALSSGFIAPQRSDEVKLSVADNLNSKTEKGHHKKDYPDGSCKDKFKEAEVMKSERDKSLESSIPEAEGISMSVEDAEKELKLYKELIKTRHETHLKEMKDCLTHLSKGRKIININEVMNKAGVREDGLPKLAIARADLKKIYLHREEKGRVCFSASNSRWSQYKKDSVWLPAETFPEFIRKQSEQYGFIVYQALVPIIPAVFMPKYKLSNYWILWEVDEWSQSPKPPRDPLLLKRINETTFAVLAIWDLTDLERSVMGVASDK